MGFNSRHNQRRAPVKLRDDREYTRVRGQWVRVKQAPESAKPCHVLLSGKACYYDKRQKRLFVHPLAVTEFPSKSEAQKAIWHTTHEDGTYKDYVIKEL